MAAIRATEDPGIAIEFLHEEVEEITQAPDPAAATRGMVLAAAVTVPIAGPLMTDAATEIAEAIAHRKADLQETDEGHGVEVVFPTTALTLGRWEIQEIRPLPTTVRSVSMAETFASLRSQAAPTAASRGEDLYVFARDPEGRVQYNRTGRGGAFEGWEEVPGDMVSSSQPAAVARGGEVLVFVTDADGRVVSNRVGEDGSFAGWEPVPGDVRTDTAVGVGSRGGTVFVFARVDEDRIVFNQLLPDGTYDGWQDKSIAFR
ncbi:hypothetical protein [Streptomyces sp. TP-A0356]|uniref:hypothetical protein n=1 Tax=Streptomyces sp. TP-A0356 TaxID=1359208 RepID=UPI0006E175C2|nr:hypothetical protein [Streptomyces sp. TP-A0356]